MTKDFKKSTGGRPRLNENVIEEKILQFLKNNGKSDSKTIIKQLNHSRNNIERILNKMQEKGLIIVVNDIKYTTKGRNGRVWDIRNTESFINLTVK
jgi:predicted transcriptional regulator